jgi:phosphopantothenoylcysteine decarboxylase/phosphopantothenate--cysteine ligase
VGRAVRASPCIRTYGARSSRCPTSASASNADLVVVAPATADLLARAAAGLAGDLLTNVLLTARCPVVFAPAMHTEMWDHPATQANVSTLIERGAHVIPPASGRLTGADAGRGRLPDPEAIFAICEHLLAKSAAPATAVASDRGDYAGVRVLITAGGTREPLDPVRFLGNRSSGKQGYAVAARAAARGAHVRWSAPMWLSRPRRGGGHRGRTALEMQAAVRADLAWADVVVMAAAVADFRPRHMSRARSRRRTTRPTPRTAPVIELVRNPDILAGLVAERGTRARR